MSNENEHFFLFGCWFLNISSYYVVVVGDLLSETITSTISIYLLCR